jgi:hypothetical protein
VRTSGSVRRSDALCGTRKGHAAQVQVAADDCSELRTRLRDAILIGFPEPRPAHWEGATHPHGKEPHPQDGVRLILTRRAVLRKTDFQPASRRVYSRTYHLDDSRAMATPRRRGAVLGQPPAAAPKSKLWAPDEHQVRGQSVLFLLLGGIEMTKSSWVSAVPRFE